MVRPSLLVLLTSLIVASGSLLAVPANHDFVVSGIDSLAAVSVKDLNSVEFPNMIVSPVDGRFGETLRGRLAANLLKKGISAYLTPNNSDSSGKFLLQSTINDYSLKYIGTGGGVFRQGKVVREFAILSQSRLLADDGKLVRTLDAQSFILSDTLTFDQARRVRGEDAFYAPGLPPTTFQRLVEPGIIAGITGILVYLFFASR